MRGAGAVRSLRRRERCGRGGERDYPDGRAILHVDTGVDPLPTERAQRGHAVFRTDPFVVLIRRFAATGVSRSLELHLGTLARAPSGLRADSRWILPGFAAAGAYLVQRVGSR